MEVKTTVTAIPALNVSTAATAEDHEPYKPKPRKKEIIVPKIAQITPHITITQISRSIESRLSLSIFSGV